MKGLKSTIPRALPAGALIDVADNTGARAIMLIQVKGYRGVKRRYPAAGIGDLIIGSVKKGSPEMRKQVVHAVILRQRKEFRRAHGMRVKFEDNAAAITDENGEPKGTEIKGPVAQEVVERFSKVAAIASTIV
ncbi:MAG: 50S ribosomal protein L14 [Halobacteria archaeon]